MERIALTNTDKLLTEVISKAVAVLQAGGLVIFPTETTYGAGVDATNPEAVAKLLRYKARREGKPLSIAVTDQTMAEEYAELNDQARTLYHQFLPGPVTVISKGKGKAAPGVESEFGTIGVRIPDHQLILAIVHQLGRPVTATSANPSDGARPYAIDSLLPTLSNTQTSLIDLVLDAGELVHNPPSTIIDTTLSTPITLRQGEIDGRSATSVLAPLATDSSARRLHITTDTTTTVTLQSASPAETQGIAGRLLLKHWNDIHQNGLIIALDGPLGAGKTVFAQGAAQFLGITTQLTSPTYTYIEEYPYTRHLTSGMLYHLDMWKIDGQAVFTRLGFDQLLKPNNVVLIEWFSQVQPFIETLLSNQDGTKPAVLYITIE